VITFSKPVKEGSSATYAVTLTDEDGNTVTPSAVTWTLGDTEGNIVNSRDDVSGTPGNPTNITLVAADTKYEDGPYRQLIVKFTYNSTYGTGLTANEELRISIKDLFDVS
jgi:hypothetical protein